jgi:hypothetical protein
VGTVQMPALRRKRQMTGGALADRRHGIAGSQQAVRADGEIAASPSWERQWKNWRVRRPTGFYPAKRPDRQAFPQPSRCCKAAARRFRRQPPPRAGRNPSPRVVADIADNLLIPMPLSDISESGARSASPPVPVKTIFLI